MTTIPESTTSSAAERMLSIHFTDRCNNRCVFCVVDSPSVRKDSVSAGQIVAFLEANQGKGYAAVNIHGGEPTTRRDFLELLQRIRDLGYPSVILQTNARKLSRREFADQVVGLGCSKIVVSVHGSNSQVHDGITLVADSLRHAIHGIRNVKALGAHVRTNTVVSQMNYTDLPAIAELLLDLGVDHVNISALHTAGTAYKNFDAVTPWYAEVAPYVLEAAHRVADSGTTLTLEGFPHCTLPGLQDHFIDWDNQHFTMLFRDKVLDDYEAYMDSSMRTHGEPCEQCPSRGPCGGVYREYAEFRGWSEFGPAGLEHGEIADATTS